MYEFLLYSCETWGALQKLETQLLLIEKKALKACLGVKMGTSDDIVYAEINKADIVSTIYWWQYKFYRKFMNLNTENSVAKSIWQNYAQMDNHKEKPFLDHYESLASDTIKSNIECGG